jgi:hypothetical protein
MIHVLYLPTTSERGLVWLALARPQLETVQQRAAVLLTHA